MRIRRVVSSIAAVALFGGIAEAQIHSEIALPPNGDNQRAEVSQWIGLVKITIAYHSPRVHFPPPNDRTGHIWGELVKYGLFDDGFGPAAATPWRAGANETTTISFSHDVKIEGREIKAGTYALFLELQKEGPWTWIFNTQADGWGSFQYDSSKDVLRVPVSPQPAPFTEFLTYGFDDRLPNSAVAYLSWEQKRIAFRIDVPDVNELYVAQIRKDLQAWPGFNYQNWASAALFAANNRIDLDDALTWANRAIYEPFRGAVVGVMSFSTLQVKATVLDAMGRTADADTTMDRAVRLPGTSAREIYQYGASLLRTGRTARAMAMFTLNRERHSDDKFWTSLGLARGYAASGDKPSAIANWEIVLRNVPAAQRGSIPAFEKALQTLKGSGSG